MHAPFLGLKVNSFSSCLQQKFEGKAQGLSPISGYVIDREAWMPRQMRLAMFSTV